MTSVPFAVVLAFAVVSLAGLFYINREKETDPYRLAIAAVITIAAALGAFLTLLLWVLKP